MISSPGTPSDADLTTVLAADIGSARTRLALFAQRDTGRWTVRGAADALSTAQSQREGIIGGLVTAAHELEQATGDKLLGRDGALLTGKGAADAFLASSSAAAPLRLITIAGTADRTGLWTARASRWSYTQILDQAQRDSGLAGGANRRWRDDLHQNGWDDVAAKIRLLGPDAILLTGGYDGGNVSALLATTRDILDARPANGPPLTIIFAGNQAAAPHLTRLLAGRADLRIVANVLPAAQSPQPEPAGEALDDLFCQRKLGAMCGYSAVSRLCSAPMLSSARALALAWTALAAATKVPVLGLDIGASSTIAGLATADEGYGLFVEPALGIAQGWDSPLRSIATTDIARWIPIPLSKTEIRTRLATRHVSVSIPKSNDALLFQEALTREAWRAACAGARCVQPLPEPTTLNIVGSGGVVMHAPSLWRAALMLLDAVEPLGLAHLWADRRGLLAQIGALAAVKRDAAQSLLQGGGLCHVGLAVCMDGATTAGSKCADIELKLEDGSLRRTIAAWGSLHLLPTDGLGPVTVTIKPVRGVNVPGYGSGQPLTLEVADAELGVILDCRGRPVAAQLDPQHSFALMRAWIAAGEQ